MVNTKLIMRSKLVFEMNRFHHYVEILFYFFENSHISDFQPTELEFCCKSFGKRTSFEINRFHYSGFTDFFEISHTTVFQGTECKTDH